MFGKDLQVLCTRLQNYMIGASPLMYPNPDS